MHSVLENHFQTKFLSTPSARRATTWVSQKWERGTKFLSTPSARRATWPCGRGVAARPISIHALREEGDMPKGAMRRTASRFLSTPSARRATRCRPPWQCRGSYFYPRPPRGGRPSITRSIQTPLQKISIHALREEGDTGTTEKPAPYEDFYPRPPRGGRLIILMSHAVSYGFLSTPSARRATLAKFDEKTGLFEFLSTPSARRATSLQTWENKQFSNFYPRPPRGGRQVYRKLRHSGMGHFYPRPPRGGRLPPQFLLLLPFYDFYPRPPRGGRRGAGRKPTKDELISIHALREEGDAVKFLLTFHVILFLSTPSARRATNKCPCGSYP